MAEPRTRLQKRREAVTTLALFMIVLVIFGGLGAGAAWEASRDRGRPVAAITGEKPLVLFGARGDEVSFYLTGESAGGKWAAGSGLSFEFRGQSLTVVEETEPDWDETIKGGLGDFEITGTLRIPDVPGPETMVADDGVIQGTLRLPQPTGEREFDNRSESVSVPVTLELMTPGAAEARRVARQGLMPTLMTVGIWGAIGGAILGILLALYASRLTRRIEAEPKQG